MYYIQLLTTLCLRRNAYSPIYTGPCLIIMKHCFLYMVLSYHHSRMYTWRCILSRNFYGVSTHQYMSLNIFNILMDVNIMLCTVSCCTYVIGINLATRLLLLQILVVFGLTLKSNSKY